MNTYIYCNLRKEQNIVHYIQIYPCNPNNTTQEYFLKTQFKKKN